MDEGTLFFFFFFFFLKKKKQTFDFIYIFVCVCVCVCDWVFSSASFFGLLIWCFFERERERERGERDDRWGWRGAIGPTWVRQARPTRRGKRFEPMPLLPLHTLTVWVRVSECEIFKREKKENGVEVGGREGWDDEGEEEENEEKSRRMDWEG